MTAPEARWGRRFAFFELSAADAAALLGQPVLRIEPLSGGLRNSNYRVELRAQADPIVLRIYTADEALACRRERAVLRLIEGTVPAPRVLRANPDASPPWSLLTFQPGQRMDLALEHASEADAARWAASAGEVLAHIHAYEFECAGFFGADLEIAEPMSVQHGWAEWIAGWLVNGNAGGRLGRELTEQVLRFVEEHAAEMGQSRGTPVLLHADYKPWNLFVEPDEISGVLDWEFALAGDRLLDIGIFLRYRDTLAPSYVDAFVRGYRQAGGTLPADWARLSRMVDLINLVQLIDRGDVEDPAVTASLRPLVEATLREAQA